MAKYTLKTYKGRHLLERFTNRGAEKLRSVLSHSKNHKGGLTGPFGEELNNADKFVICDSQMETLFEGNVTDALHFIKTLP